MLNRFALAKVEERVVGAARQDHDIVRSENGTRRKVGGGGGVLPLHMLIGVQAVVMKKVDRLMLRR